MQNKFLMYLVMLPMLKSMHDCIKFFTITIVSICWAIWKERNMVHFDNVIFSQERLKNSFIKSLTSWTNLIYEGEYSIVNLLMCIL